jgi:hypothetical protein
MNTKKTYIICLFSFTACLMFSGCEKKLGEGVTLENIQVEESLKVNVGETERAHAWPIPWDCTNYEFKWESADTTIAKVDNYGRVTAEDVGNTVIYVSQGDIKKEISLEVYEVTLAEKLNALSGLVGFWQFDDASNFQKATVGKDLIAYLRSADEVIGVPSVEGLSQVAGYNKRDYAVSIGHHSLFFADHGISATTGSSLVKEYTILWDINRPSGESGYATLLNTSIANSNDQDYAIKNSGVVGVGTCGYSTLTMSRDTWYRVIICLKADEYLRIYVNGVKWLEGENYTNDRFGLDPLGTLIMGDDDSDDHTIYLSSVAIFDRVLTEDEISTIGGL